MDDWLGIIAEYNPFHNGHQYHLAQAKAETGCKKIIVALSGNFAQRGEPAIVNKWLRAQMAVTAGADLVVEIPCYHVLQSAEGFARAGVALLAACFVGTISFGSESGQMSKLQALARWFELPDSQTAIRQQLSTGISYADAIQNALEGADSGLAPLLSGSNNILGLEYIRAAKKFAPDISFHTVKRAGPGGNYASASYLRQMLASSQWQKALPYIPPAIVKTLLRAIEEYGPITLNSFQQAICYSLAMTTAQQLRLLPAVSEGLEQRMLKLATRTGKLAMLLDLAKTRRYPRTRLQRLLCQLLLGFDKMPEPQPLLPYIRVLALKQSAREMIPRIVKHGYAPLVMGWRDAKQLTPAGLKLLQLDRQTGIVYNLATDNPLPLDSERLPIFLPG